jgi:hypothetical protein
LRYYLSPQLTLTQIKKTFDLALRAMRLNYIPIVVAMTAMLIGATAFASVDSVFAIKKKYEKSQAIPQENACGDGDLPMVVLCSNTASQIQGDDNSVANAAVQVDGKDGFKKKTDW